MTLPTRIHSIVIGGQTVHLELPADPEQMLQEAVDGESSGDRHTDPYWGLLWDAAPKTAESVLRQHWTAGLTALELGCGIGLAGIAGLFAGLDVTFSDLVPTAVEMAVRNAGRNGFPGAKGLVLDWRRPEPRTFDILLASDVLYDRENHRPLLQVLERMLAEGGSVWIGDAGRHNAPLFIEDARLAGWEVRLQDEYGQSMERPSHVKFQLLVMQKSQRAS